MLYERTQSCKYAACDDAGDQADDEPVIELTAAAHLSDPSIPSSLALCPGQNKASSYGDLLCEDACIARVQKPKEM